MQRKNPDSKDDRPTEPRRQTGAASTVLAMHERDLVSEIVLLGIPILILIGLVTWYASRFVDAFPPNRISIATGSKSGAYIGFGYAYAEVLGRSDIKLNVLVSRGSVDNLQRLSDPASKVDAALIQGGVVSEDEAKELRSLGRVFYEPLWVFYRGSEAITLLSQLKGKRLAIGPKGSGTRQLAKVLLQANHLGDRETRLLPVSGKEAAEALKAGQIEAMFVVAAPSAPLVQDLLSNDRIKLMSFERAKAYAQRFPYLSHIQLPRGVIDFQRDLPKTEIQLIAAMAAIVVRKDLHSAVISLLAEAAKEVHEGNGLFHHAGTFPKPLDPVIPMANEAKRFYKFGHPFLWRYFPFWLVILIERILLIVLPLVTLLLPIITLTPKVYHWRMRRRIFLWYGKLHQLEEAADAASDVRTRQRHIAELSRIDDAVKEVRVPLVHAEELFALREHIELMRRRLSQRGAGELS